MDECVVINVRLRDAIDDSVPATLKIPYQITWPDFELLLKLNFECTSIALRYVDEDGDQVIISDQDGLFEAFRYAKSCGNVLHLILYEIEPDTSVKALEAARNNNSTQDSSINSAAMASGDTPPSYATVVDSVGLNTILELSQDGAVGETCVKEKLVKFDFPSPPSTEPGSLAAESGASPAIIILSEQELLESQETGEQRRESSVHIDKETGAVEFKCHESRAKKKKAESHRAKLAKETGEVRRSHSQPDESRKKRHKRRSSEAEGREGRAVAQDDSVVSYSALFEFLDKLKTDLRTEIVRDVTRKTVKQVLKGLDGAVIQTVNGTSGVPMTPTSQSSTSTETSPETPTENTEKTDNLKTHPIYCHDGIVCDNCDQTIVGSRYKCGNCLDYDLCEQCEALDGIHIPDHVFVKIRRPCLGAGHVGGMCTPLLRCCIYDNMPDAVVGDSTLSSETTSLNNSQSILVPKWERLKEEMHRIKEKVKKEKQSFKKQIKMQKQEEKLRLKMSYNRHDRKGRTEHLERLRYSRKLDAQFISDVTVPDETCVQPGTRLTKSWLIRNTGNIGWSENTKLRMMWGNMAAVATEVSVPHLEPGKEAHVTVALIAPNEPGRYQSHWKMFDDSVNFGHRVWCVILVQPKELLEPTKESSLKVVSEYENIQDCVDDVVDAQPKPVHEISPIPCVIIDEETPLLLHPENLAVPLTPVLVETDCTVATTVEPRSELVEVISETTTQNDDKVETDLNNAIASLKIIGIDVTATVSLCDVDVNKATNADSDEVEVDGNEKADEEVEESHNEMNQHDLMSFELLDLNRDRENKEPKASQTATPNNTPLVMSPPKSPVLGSPAEKAIISSSSSVEMVNDDGMADEVLSPTMTDYVQQRMASLGFKPNINVDLESISSMSDDSFDDDFSDSSGSDGDFFIVPLPDCFDPSKPLAKSMVASVQSELPSNENQDAVNVEDEISRSLPVVCTDAGTGDDDKPSCTSITTTGSTTTTSSSSSSSSSSTSSGSCSSGNTSTTTVTSLPQTYEETHVVKTQDPNGDTIVTTTTVVSTTSSSSMTSVKSETDVAEETGDNSREPASDNVGGGKKTITINIGEIESRVEAAAEEAARNDAKSQTQKESKPASEDQPCGGQSHDELPHSPSDFANHLVATAVHAAARAATQAYSTARDVFWTLQAKNSQNAATPTPAPRRRGKAPDNTKPRGQETGSTTNERHTETLSESQESHKEDSASESSSEQQQASDSDKKQEEQPSNKDQHDDEDESEQWRWDFWQAPPPDIDPASVDVHASPPYVEVNWMPPLNKWQPPANNWMPPPNNWTPPPNNWQPPPPFMPPHAAPPPPSFMPPMPAPPTPPFMPLPPHVPSFMSPPTAHAPPPPERPPFMAPDTDLLKDSIKRLVEMGFYNRDLNLILLRRFNNDLEKVIQELVQRNINDWHSQRH